MMSPAGLTRTVWLAPLIFNHAVTCAVHAVQCMLFPESQYNVILLTLYQMYEYDPVPNKQIHNNLLFLQVSCHSGLVPVPSSFL